MGKGLKRLKGCVNMIIYEVFYRKDMADDFTFYGKTPVYDEALYAYNCLKEGNFYVQIRVNGRVVI